MVLDIAERLPKTAGMEAEAGPEFVHRHSRRLSDKILGAFHHACDVNDLSVAIDLLQILEFMTMRRPRAEDGHKRREIQGLVAAHERLWHLRHPPHD